MSNTGVNKSDVGVDGYVRSVLGSVPVEASQAELKLGQETNVTNFSFNVMEGSRQAPQC